MTLFTIPTFPRRPSFTLPFSQPTTSPHVAPLAEKSINVPTLRRTKVSISSPRSLSSATSSSTSRRQPPSPTKKSSPRRVTRSNSRSHFLVPDKSTPTQTVTLTSATSSSSQAKDIEDVDINTISFPSPPSPPRTRSHSSSKGNFSPPFRPSSPTPPHISHGRSSPPRQGMGRGRGFSVPVRAGLSCYNPRIRTSTSPPSAGSPPIQKRARLTSLSRSPANKVVEIDDVPERPGSPTPGSGPSAHLKPAVPIKVLRPTPVRPSPHHNTKKIWDAISTSPRPNSKHLPPSNVDDDDDDDIIVFRMDVDITSVSLKVEPPELKEVEMAGCTVASPPSVATDLQQAGCMATGPEEVLLNDPREDMQKQSMILAKRVRKRMNPLLSDDVPPPVPSPIKLRQAIATMFLEHGNTFPPIRRRSPPGLDGGRQRSPLCMELFTEQGTVSASI